MYLQQFPMLSFFPAPVFHSLDILYRCPPQRTASPPVDRQTFDGGEKESLKNCSGD